MRLFRLFLCTALCVISMKMLGWAKMADSELFKSVVQNLRREIVEGTL